MREPVNKSIQSLNYNRRFTWFSTDNIHKQRISDLTKIAIKNNNITFFGGVFHVIDTFSKLKLEELTDFTLEMDKNLKKNMF